MCKALEPHPPVCDFQVRKLAHSDEGLCIVQMIYGSSLIHLVPKGKSELHSPGRPGAGGLQDSAQESDKRGS